MLAQLAGLPCFDDAVAFGRRLQRGLLYAEVSVQTEQDGKGYEWRERLALRAQPGSSMPPRAIGRNRLGPQERDESHQQAKGIPDPMQEHRRRGGSQIFLFTPGRGQPPAHQSASGDVQQPRTGSVQLLRTIVPRWSCWQCPDFPAGQKPAPQISPQAKPWRGWVCGLQLPIRPGLDKLFNHRSNTEKSTIERMCVPRWASS